MGVEHHGGVGVGHVGPAFQDGVVLVDDGAHHGADVERFFAVFVGLGGEDVADGAELAGGVGVRVGADVAVGGVGGVGAAREAFPGGAVGVVVVGEEDVAGALQVRCPVLGLSVGSHHPVVAADAEVVFGRHPPGVVQGLFPGEHHGAVGGHDQDAFGVHQHGRFGVPVGLGADVDAGDDDVDLAAVLGEGDDFAQRARHPVHVLGAAGHRDGGPRGQREPFHRCRQLFGEVQGGDDAGAFGFGDGAQCFGGVAEQGDAGHPFGVAVGWGGSRRRR